MFSDQMNAQQLTSKAESPMPLLRMRACLHEVNQLDNQRRASPWPGFWTALMCVNE